MPLIGRMRHLDALADAMAAMKRGRTVALFVHGRSGMGKTTLLQRFLGDVVACDEAVVLSGRC
jgi:ABC-type lipoprotein export system ATPase subunit